MLSNERNGLAGNIAGELHIGIQGPPGPQGDPGKDGGSTTITLKYGVSSTPSMNTVTGWQETIPQMSETYPYLWIEISTETITATGGSSTIEAGIIGYYSVPDSGGNGDLIPELKTALINYFTHVIPIFDDANGLSYINAILTALGAETRGEPEEPDAPVEPDEPDVPVVKTYTVTNNLTNVSNSNSVASVEENASYSATLTADDGYELDSVTVTMGGADITATAYASGVVTIGAVTGNVVITAVAVEVKEEVIYTLGGKKYGAAGSEWTDESGSSVDPIGANGIHFLSNDTFETDTQLAIEFNYASTYQHAIYIGSYDGSALHNVRLFGAKQYIAGTVFTENYTVKSGCQLCIGFGNAVSPTITVKGV